MSEHVTNQPRDPQAITRELKNVIGSGVPQAPASSAAEVALVAGLVRAVVTPAAVDQAASDSERTGFDSFVHEQLTTADMPETILSDPHSRRVLGVAALRLPEILHPPMAENERARFATFVGGYANWLATHGHAYPEGLQTVLDRIATAVGSPE